LIYVQGEIKAASAKDDDVKLLEEINSTQQMDEEDPNFILRRYITTQEQVRGHCIAG
jgi:hypothetical protein